MPPLFLLLGCSLLCAPPARPDRKPARARAVELPHQCGRPELRPGGAPTLAQPPGAAGARGGAPARTVGRSCTPTRRSSRPHGPPGASVEERRSHAPEQGGGARFKLNAGAGLRGRSRRKIQGPSLGGPPSEVGRLRPDLHRYWRYGLGKRKKGGGREEREKVPPPSSSSNRNRQVVEPNRSRRPAAPPPFYSLFNAQAMPDCL